MIAQVDFARPRLSYFEEYQYKITVWFLGTQLLLSASHNSCLFQYGSNKFYQTTFAGKIDLREPSARQKICRKTFIGARSNDTNRPCEPLRQNLHDIIVL
jgi:hypothetical protein